MTIEMYNITKPAYPHRAIGLPLLFLLACSALATQMAYRRSQDPLGYAVSPPDWSITFRAPKRFERMQWLRVSPSLAIPFLRRAADGREAILVFWRESGTAPPDSARLCAQIVGQIDSVEGLSPPGGEPLITMKPLAGRNGTEQRTAQGFSVARAAVLADRQVYAVSLSVKGTPIDDHLYEMFDRTCRAIKFRGKSSHRRPK